jgi:fucose permease
MVSPKSRTVTAAWVLLAVVYAAYISMGLPDGIFGATWPQVRAEFGVSLNANWPIYIVGLAGGLISSFSAGTMLRRLGVGRLLLFTTALTAASIAGVGFSPWFTGLILLAFFLGLGNGAIDACLNHYIASHFSSRHMNWLHACWGVGVSLGTSIVSGAYALGSTWRGACLAIALVQALLAIVFLRLLKVWDSAPSVHSKSGDAHGTQAIPLAKAGETFRLSATWVGMAMFFLYCGIEFGTGVWTTSLLQGSRGWSIEKAALFVTLFWGSLTAGRFLIGIVSVRLGPTRVLRVSISGVILGTSLIGLSSLVTATVGSGILTASGLLITGLCLAPIYPTLMHDTPNCVGREHSANLIGYQSGAANLGLTLIPGIIGTIMKHSSLEFLGPLLLIPAVALFILFLVRERMKKERCATQGA